MNTFREIQLANTLRAKRWHTTGLMEWSGLEWAGAMCGEAGEAANVAKKLRRIECGITGNKSEDTHDALVRKLALELADTAIYMSLLASHYGIDLDATIVDAFNAKSEQLGLPERVTL